MAALKVLDGDPIQRYSTKRRRSLIAMVARRTFQRVNRPASHILVRPFVVMVARALGPGSARLRLVKLAHNLDHHAFIGDHHAKVLYADAAAAAQPTTRAA